MIPRADKTKVKLVMKHKGIELYQAPGYGKGPTFDIPGGAGVSDSFWRLDTKKKQQEKARKEYNYLLSVEQRLRNLPFRHEENKKEFKRLMESMIESRKSQEGTNSNK